MRETCLILLLPCVVCVHSIQAASAPPSWTILPTPRYVDYGSPESFINVTNVAIVRRQGGPYQTIRDKDGELVGHSTVTEEELVRLLTTGGAAKVESLSDTGASYDAFDTLVVLGSPEHNSATGTTFDALHLSFTKWDDPRTPDHDFNDWKDLGNEGYVLKVGKSGGKNIVILAGYDFDASSGRFWGAGTFYALQSLRQLIVNDGGALRIKTVEAADKPLIAVRGCYTGWPVSEEVNLRSIALLPPLKMNQNIFWYGSQVATYNTQSCSKFRYPWTSEQLAFCRKVGKYCREHFIVQVFGMNADHYNVAWAAAKTLDGTQKDPLHYDLGHEVEPGVKEMWKQVGYEVKTDVDVLAAKYDQLYKVCPTAVLAMFNEDDVFGLVHEDDKKLYGVTGDAKHDAIAYGKARGIVLAALYKRIKQMCPSSPGLLPVCPPGNVAYQVDLENNAYNCRDFMTAFTSTLKSLGVLDRMPMMTTGGGTAAEVTTNKNLDDFKSWCSGGPVLISDNNFPYQHVGAYQTDPKAAHSYLQQNKEYPAGFREKGLYKRVWGIWANGITQENGDILGWCTTQYMWNILAMEKQSMDEAATRKVASEDVYPLARSFYEEYDDAACYLPDELRADPPFALSDTIRFASKNWYYVVTYTDNMRLEAQRLRDKLGQLIRPLESRWDSARLRWMGYDVYTWCSVYLARGYIKGWQDATATDRLSGRALCDVYLEADDIQQRFFAGPLKIAGRMPVERGDDAYYSGKLVKLITGERIKSPIATSVAECREPYVDIWKEGLLGKFYDPVSSVVPADLPDADVRLAGNWGKVEEAEKEKFRTLSGHASVRLATSLTNGRYLMRAKIGTSAASLTDGTKVSFSASGAAHEDTVCKPRWISWLMPEGLEVASLEMNADSPVRVYAVEVYRESVATITSSEGE